MKALLYLYLRIVLVPALIICLQVPSGAQDTRNETRDTVSVRIQGDSIIYRYRTSRLKNESAPVTRIRTVPDSVVQKLKEDDAFAYANDPSFWKKEPPPDNSAIEKFITWLARSTFLKWLLYIFLAAVALFVIYQLIIVNGSFVFAKRNKKLSKEQFKEEDVDSTDLDALIDSAVAEKNYRFAVRYLYLKTLRLLNERGILVQDAKATNVGYASQIKSAEKRKEFLKLTNIYEYAWYGDYSLDEHQFDIAQQNFKRFLAAQ